MKTSVKKLKRNNCIATHDKPLNAKARHTRTSTVTASKKPLKSKMKKVLLSKKVEERKVKSQCTASRNPMGFQDISLEYVNASKG